MRGLGEGVSRHSCRPGVGERALRAGVEKSIRLLGDTEVSKQVLRKSLCLAVGELL
ncbi:hypothetical protein SAMN05660282_00381 [Corynebacterium spheniscorum]|uniref:Uncharacterized protein n=1 Tax=Corynebacterium spheniscorum TaxID=185761 RepID=A0A1I2QJK8_9CORY|nr:hypothetical protein SAMN05660282_00381 [Corynebacterium spheniscorum]